jgi:glutamyl-tRNA synthetase
MITRIAPTPSGYLHLGNVFNFLLTWLWARSNQGKVLLRIDDADAQRKRAVYLEDIFRTLDVLGLDWDMGPSGPGDFEQHWSQVHRVELYNALLQQLTQKQILYACRCSRSQLLNTVSSFQCNCADKALPLDTEGTCLRMRVAAGECERVHDLFRGAIYQELNSFVVRRKDGVAAYHVGSLADDYHFGITHIVRGDDLMQSTAIQLYIDKQLDHPVFQDCTFWHHPLVVSLDGIKLSKSAGIAKIPFSATMNKAAVLSAFITWMGWDHNQYQTLEDLISHPDLKLKGQ